MQQIEEYYLVFCSVHLDSYYSLMLISHSLLIIYTYLFFYINLNTKSHSYKWRSCMVGWRYLPRIARICCLSVRFILCVYRLVLLSLGCYCVQLTKILVILIRMEFEGLHASVLFLRND